MKRKKNSAEKNSAKLIRETESDAVLDDSNHTASISEKSSATSPQSVKDSVVNAAKETSAEIKSDSAAPCDENFATNLREATENLIYISETDAPWEIFSSEQTFQKEITAQTLQTLEKHLADKTFEKISFEQFFEKLTQIKEWFTDKDRADAGKYLKIKEILQKNLTDLKVYRFGKIQIDIYIVGKSGSNGVCGLKTKAVET